MTRQRLKILVVDDEPALREVLEMRLAAWGYRVVLASDGDAARAVTEREQPDLVLTDVVMPDLSGLDLLRALRTGEPHRPVILMTAYGSIDEAVEAMKLGARDFLTKPLDYGKLRAILGAVEDEFEQRNVARQLQSTLEREGRLGTMVGTSTAMRSVYELVQVVATSEAPVIITGESGTGKELVARTIHDLSPRRSAPFIAVNSAAIPEGLTESELLGHEKGAFTGAVASRPGWFEQAHAGTLFLDEITEMPPSLQPKFLRVLEDGRVRRVGGSREQSFDVRVVAATNRDVDEALAEGLLREDLFYRLNVFTIAIPPLRERPEDLALLAQHFVDHFSRRHELPVEGLSAGAQELLASYSWPGNVRELRNVVERAVILAREGWIESVHLPPYVQKTERTVGHGIRLPRDVTAAEAEKILIVSTLEETGGNKAEAARRLGLDVKTIRNKLKGYGRDEE
jgi:DNA-binding NtrC family response regulator